ncbi:hypothetical protein BHM03_00050775 [Ensete ventricosum]|nr:hypothetical protein BHM03_00050775 [Ensete ventricosum]
MEQYCHGSLCLRKVPKKGREAPSIVVKKEAQVRRTVLFPGDPRKGINGRGVAPSLQFLSVDCRSLLPFLNLSSVPNSIVAILPFPTSVHNHTAIKEFVSPPPLAAHAHCSL